MKRKTIIGVLISAVFLYFAVRNVDRAGMGETLREADYRVVLLVFALMLVSLAFRALRWGLLFRPDHRVGFSHLFSASAIGLMSNNILPARLGEFVRAWVIGTKTGISKSTSFATIVVERLLDGCTVIFFLVALLVWRTDSVPASIRTGSAVVAGLYGAAVLVLLLIRSGRVGALNFVRAVSKPLPERARARFMHLFDAFIDGLAVMHSPRHVLAASVLSLAVWIPNVAAIHFVLNSFGMDLPLHSAVVVFIVVTFGIMIPSAPGFVGTIQYGFVLALGLFGMPESFALSASILYHVGVYIPLTVAGVVCVLAEGISFSMLRRGVVDGGAARADGER